jgi:signal transduction histidine kinase
VRKLGGAKTLEGRTGDDLVVYDDVFRALALPLALLKVDDEGVRLVDANPTFLRMTRLLPWDFDNRAVEDVLGPDAALAIAAGAARAASTRKDVRVRANLIPASVPALQDALLSPLNRGPKNQIVLLNAERRLHDRGLAERRSTQAFGHLEQIIEGLIYVYDVGKRRAVYVAPRLAEMLGREPGDQVDNDRARDRVHPDDVAAFDAHVAALADMDDWSIETAEVRFPTGAAGEWRSLELRARVLNRDRAGGVRQVLGVATDVTDRRTMTAALDQASIALLDAAESERRRVARDLHDSTAQHLVAIDLGVGALLRRLEPHDDEVRIFRDLRASLASAHQEIRAFAYLLHPPLLRRRGLVRALKQFVTGFARRTALDIDLRLPRRARPIPEPVEVALFRVCQEALMNVHRHANAQHVRVELTLGRDSAVLEIEDDGVGLGDTTPGVGIVGMRARLAQLGGRLTLSSLPVGARIRATAPLPPVGG